MPSSCRLPDTSLKPEACSPVHVPHAVHPSFCVYLLVAYLDLVATFGILVYGRYAYERRPLTYALFLFCMLFTWLRFSCRHLFNMQFSLLLAVVATNWQLCISTLPNAPPGTRSRKLPLHNGRSLPSFLSTLKFQSTCIVSFLNYSTSRPKQIPARDHQTQTYPLMNRLCLDSISRRLHTSHHR
jgi:hypothetical protein